MRGAPRAWLAAALALAGLGLSAAAAAQERPPIYRMVWNVRPQGLVGETRIIRPAERALTLALTPPALFRTAQDVRDAQGEVLAPAGTQFVGLLSAARIACTIHQMERRGVEQALFLGSLKRICLIDADRDGRFERRFLRSTNGQAFFLLRGRLSDRQQPIEPVALIEEDVGSLRGAPTIQVKLDRGSEADQRVILTMEVGGDGHGFALGPRLVRRAPSLPATFDLYGGRIEVAPQPDGTFRVRTLAPFSAQHLDFWD